MSRDEFEECIMRLYIVQNKSLAHSLFKKKIKISFIPYYHLNNNRIK